MTRPTHSVNDQRFHPLGPVALRALIRLGVRRGIAWLSCVACGRCMADYAMEGHACDVILHTDTCSCDGPTLHCPACGCDPCLCNDGSWRAPHKRCPACGPTR